MPEAQTKTCQNCKNQFTIELDDFAFYDNMKVPSPTFCPDCRLQRRVTFRNERALYKHPCGLCGKEIISMFRKDSPYTVYCQKCWWGDGWNPLDYGKDYDFSKPFFAQLNELMKKVPLPALFSFYETLVGSEYTNLVSNLKNCYLIFNSDYDENCLYGTEIESSKDCIDNLMIDGCQLSAHNVNCQNCYSTFYSIDCESCHNIWFSKNCMGCSNCFACANLRNQQYYVFNEKYSKEEYEKRLREFNLGSYASTKKHLRLSREHFLKFPSKFIHGRQNTNVSGDYILHAKEVRKSFIVTEAQNCKYCVWVIVKPTKDCWDYTEYGEAAEKLYECVTFGGGASDCKFNFSGGKGVAALSYCTYCFTNMQEAFGCVGMRKKSYCILNKQCSKEVYGQLVPKIIEHMNAMPYVDAKGREYRYGEFFPAELSPFAYNESTAQQFFPLEKTEAETSGFHWSEPEERNYAVTTRFDELPDHIRDVPDEILNDIIGCEHEGRCNEQCTTAFKIAPQELALYRKFNLPLPRLCPNCRHYERIKQRMPFKLWRRKCMCNSGHAYTNTSIHFHADRSCPNEFETSYAPDRPEIIYCEQCYQAEVA